jgi:hypothetical protein
VNAQRTDASTPRISRKLLRLLMRAGTRVKWMLKCMIRKKIERAEQFLVKPSGMIKFHEDPFSGSHV